MPVELDTLQEALSYQFQDESLVIQALTHRSASKSHNERLEFLGDALLDFIVAEILFEKLPEATEGELTRIRAALVKKSTLAEIAQTINLGGFLILSKGEASSGGRKRAAVLADALEAIIAAIYLDSDLHTCKSVVTKLAAQKLAEAEAAGEKDFKTRLQELMQAQGRALPVYGVVEIRGEAHSQEFVVECSVELLSEPQRGNGSSKRDAEQQAARSSLLAIERLD